MTRSSIGTNQYNSPEVYHKQPYDISTDIFSLGVTLLYMFAGVYPFNYHNYCYS